MTRTEQIDLTHLEFTPHHPCDSTQPCNQAATWHVACRYQACWGLTCDSHMQQLLEQQYEADIQGRGQICSTCGNNGLWLHHFTRINA